MAIAAMNDRHTTGFFANGTRTSCMTEKLRRDVTADFHWQTIVIGADLDAVEFASEGKYFLIKNRAPRHHSYESEIETLWASKIYELSFLGKVPFGDRVNNIRVDQELKILKVFTDRDTFSVKYESLYVFDWENVTGIQNTQKLDYYRVLDWYDCQGIRDAGQLIISEVSDPFEKITLFKSTRIDGTHNNYDLVCESRLTSTQLTDFDFGDTMNRFRILELLKKSGYTEVKMNFWKRDIYPVYKNSR